MKNKINLNELLEIYNMELDDVKNLYNKSEGVVILISQEDIKAVEDGKKVEDFDEWKEEIILNALDYKSNKDKYIEFPRREDFDEYFIMEKFIQNCNDENLKVELNLNISGEDAFRAFKSALYRLDLIDQWYNFKDKEFLKFLAQWCNKNEIEYILEI
ncbi:UPF0158 family protein [Clostridium senegalense]|uniref:Uncharacterized protein n=1 Tax=Clostridium senegalense TaxID=1465809 RepID=A0A6M0H2C5_9CLOT|nr:UPF0158 family protein [Clostridium senegalense]NEU04243.1 hypothetical protein [Clostridium senegalense]